MVVEPRQAHRGQSQQTIVDLARLLLPPGQDYRVFRSSSGQAAVVPLTTWRTRLTGARLRPAYGTAQRVWREVEAGWFASAGWPAGPRLGLAGESQWSLGDALGAHLPGLQTAALLLEPGRHTKATLQLMDGRGQIVGYAKFGDTPWRRASLAHESRMLQVIPAGVGPRLIRFLHFCDADLLVVTPLPGHTCAVRMTPSAIQLALLDRLVQDGPEYQAADHPFIGRLSASAPYLRADLERIIDEFGNSRFPTARMHGDFVFINVRESHGACRAFDWEAGAVDGFPYVDAALWVLGFLKFVHGVKAVDAYDQTSAILRQCLPSRYRPFAGGIARLAIAHHLDHRTREQAATDDRGLLD